MFPWQFWFGVIIPKSIFNLVTKKKKKNENNESF